jgi:uncharacterized heparinase superfamily protein
MLSRLLRDIEFARHVPIARMIRRLRLDARRRFSDLGPHRASKAPPPPAMRADLPPPLFPPRATILRREGEDLVFHLLGVDTRMAGGRVDWRAGGDQLRRMTLHYMEYLEGVDDALWNEIVGRWLASNDVPAPGAWRDSWNSYALSLRVVVLMQELARREIAPMLRRRVEASVAQQLLHLERNLETDIGGNHLVKNTKALLWASCCFERPHAARWRTLGLRLLDDALTRQILPDGAHIERSPAYQCQVFADLLECRAALGADPLGGRLDDALRRLAQATADLAHPDGAVAQFNDAGLDMAYRPRVCLEAYARLFGEAPAPRRVFALPQAGFFGARLGDDYVVLDCGRIGPDDLPAHAHGDVLSFELSVAGRRMIVDQGVFEYVEGERRQVSRAAASHNTLSLDGAYMADFFGAFRCGRRPNVTLRRYEAREDGFLLEGAHDGYAHLPGGPVHLRRFDFSPGAITIEDRLEGRTERAARIGFLLHPEVEIVEDGESLRLARGPARLVMTASAPRRLEGAVWWPNMGVERTTRRILVDLPPGAACRVDLRFWREDHAQIGIAT